MTCVTVAGACIHHEPAAKNASGARAAQTEGDATHAPAQPSPAQPETAQPEAAPPRGSRGPQGEVLYPERLEDQMINHYLIVTVSRDALLGGGFGELQEPLAEFAQHQYPDAVSGGWAAGIAQLQAAARKSADARTIPQAADGVAAMAQACGSCHTAAGRGPRLKHLGEAPAQGAPQSLLDRMDVHAWAADRMWEGLIVPSTEAWNAGALALAQLTPASRASAPHAATIDRSALTEIRMLGEDARVAENDDERTRIYGRLLTVCVTCHTRHADDSPVEADGY